MPESNLDHNQAQNPINGQNHGKKSTHGRARGHVQGFHGAIHSQGQDQKTHPLIWGFAIICTIIAVAVILTGLIIIISYVIIHPKVPFISITYANLDRLRYDQAGTMDVEITLLIKAENDNPRSHATFSDMNIFLYFDAIQIAKLTSDPFDVPKNNSASLVYPVKSSSIPLEREAREEIDAELKRNRIEFALSGDVRTRWNVAVFKSVKVLSHLSCELAFYSNGTSIKHRCSTKSN